MTIDSQNICDFSPLHLQGYLQCPESSLIILVPKTAHELINGIPSRSTKVQESIVQVNFTF